MLIYKEKEYMIPACGHIPLDRRPVIALSLIHISNVFGQFDAFAKKIERTLQVTLVLRDDSLKIIGAQGNIEAVSYTHLY